MTWEFQRKPEAATARNCTICRRYGAVWAYGKLGENVEIKGETSGYTRQDSGNIAFHFCQHCGCVTHWLAIEAGDGGHQAIAVNLRMSEPAAVAGVRIRHFDGHETWKSVDGTARTVEDLWF